MASTTAPEPAVRISGLTKSFGPLVAVDRLDLTVARGEVVAFLGPNGAGKSTTLDVVLGFSRADAGTVTVLGDAPARAVRDGRVGAVLQAGGLLPDLTVRQTLDVVASLQCSTPDVEAVIAQTRLSGLLRRKVGKCSGGEVQRIRLALALLPRPELLVLDEPTTGMDVTARADFWETMREATAQGRAILFATHYLTEAADFADRIVIIDRGRLVADGSVDEIRALGEGTTVTASWPGLSGEPELREALASVAGSLLTVSVHGEHVELRTTAADDVARLLLTATPAVHLGISALSLDDVFTELVAQEPDAAPAP
ncbi:MAG: ABC transporter ATP-binding protein [Propionibacteriaceae bacterium]|nr:ABC transporter ATP-binding protein [Propionibacteriaceae bacterium]